MRPRKNCLRLAPILEWYWYQNYQWDLLSHMWFFSYEVNSADGQPNSTHGWATSAAVDAALASGNTKVTLCVTLFSGHATFFASPTAHLKFREVLLLGPMAQEVLQHLLKR